MGNSCMTLTGLEGGLASAHTQLQMLRLSMLQGLQTPDDLQQGQRTLLDAMIAADTQGAASAKALLAAAYGLRYQRIPWRLNDELPGRSLSRGDSGPQHMRLWPNPTNGEWSIECDAPMDELFIHDASGRVIRSIRLNGATLCSSGALALLPGAYTVRAQTRAGPRCAKLVIVP